MSLLFGKRGILGVLVFLSFLPALVAIFGAIVAFDRLYEGKLMYNELIADLPHM